ncbi:hypothetical protein WKI65_44095 [Streptomyces sp. MS1.AVA.3]|uniref:hypothetical protein n=1 Tax=Streptomyces decoyicus TaxID=249567 RepID=UPI0030BCD4F9
MARKIPAVERAVRDTLAPYVRERHMTQPEANKTVRDGLALVEHTVRQHLTDGWGGAFYYAHKTAQARQAYQDARGMMGRRIARGKMLGAEMFEAVYLAVRSDYKTAEDITAEDAEAPALLAALDVVKETAAEAAARLRQAIALAA